MSKINSHQITKIKNLLTEVESALEEGIEKPERHVESLVSYARLMLDAIEGVRAEVHYAEDADSLLTIAELLGTNCEPEHDLDYDPSEDAADKIVECGGEV